MHKELFVGPWLVQPALCRMSREGQSVRLRAKVMDLLVFLVDHPGEVLSKDALLNAIWGTEAVSESALTRSMTELRQAFGDDAGKPRVIETISKRGYRLIAPVSTIADMEPPPRIVAEPAPLLRQPFYRRLALVTALLLVAVAISVAFVAARRPAPLAFQARDWVIVTAFENKTGEPSLDGTIEYAFERELSSSSFVNVVPRDRVEDALRLMQKPLDTAIDFRVGREVCLRDGGIRALLAGRIEKIGGRYELTTQIVNPLTDVIVASFDDEWTGMQEAIAAVRRQGIAVRRMLGEEPGSLEASEAQLAKVTTLSLRALQAYSHAAELMSPGSPFQNATAERFLRDALREDPNFASAHILLAWTLRNQGRSQQEYLAHADEARRLAATTTVVERHFIEGSFHVLRAESAHDLSEAPAEWQAAAAEYETVLRLQPDHPWALNNARNTYSRLGRTADSATLMGRAADLRPNDYSTAAAAGQAILEARGSVDAARPYLARARRLLEMNPTAYRPSPVNTYTRMFPVHELWIRRQVKEAAALVQTLGRRPEVAADGDWALARLGSLHVTLGQPQLAAEAFARINDANQRTIHSAIVALALNHYSGVVTQLQSVAAEDLAPVSLLVRAGNLAAAERLLNRVRGVPRQHMQWAAEEIDEARGNKSRITEALEAGPQWIHVMSGVRAFLYSETLARAAAGMGDTERAIDVLEQTDALKERTYTPSSHTAYFWMRTQLLLAELYRQVGRITDARKIERDLLAALAAADEDFPMLVELRTRTD